MVFIDLKDGFHKNHMVRLNLIMMSDLLIYRVFARQALETFLLICGGNSNKKQGVRDGDRYKDDG